jgi:hypothetical protein
MGKATASAAPLSTQASRLRPASIQRSAPVGRCGLPVACRSDDLLVRTIEQAPDSNHQAAGRVRPPRPRRPHRHRPRPRMVADPSGFTPGGSFSLSATDGHCRFSHFVGAIRESPHAAVLIRRAVSGGSRTAPTRKHRETEKIDSLDRCLTALRSHVGHTESHRNHIEWPTMCPEWRPRPARMRGVSWSTIKVLEERSEMYGGQP